MATSANAGGLVREVIRANTGTARAGGVVREVIRVSTGQIRIGGVVREALVTTGATSPATRAIVDGVVREALVFTVGPALPTTKPWLRAHFALEADEPEQWQPPRRGVVPTPAATRHLRPYLLINS